jgi:hypothetical protein
MKPWLRLTLTLVGLALVCLLLNLTQAVALNHPLQTVGSGPRLDRGGKAASDAPSSSLVRCMEFDPARVASLVLDRALRAGNISPPGEKDPRATRTDGAWASCRSSRQLKPPPSSNLLREITGFQPRIEEPGFCNSL